MDGNNTIGGHMLVFFGFFLVVMNVDLPFFF